MQMTIVIPMAGHGQRFVDAGYPVPKYLLEAHGKTMLQWSVDSLPLQAARRTVFVGLRAHEATYGVERLIRSLYGAGSELSFVWIDHVTRGQAETVLLAGPMIDPDGSLMIFNIDTAFASDTLQAAVTAPGVDAVLGSFWSNEPRFSYARTDAAGRVVEVAEKDVISPHALTGLYHFGRAEWFLTAANRALRDDRRTKGEFFVAPLYNELIAAGRNIVLDPTKHHVILGTPQEYEAFRTSPNPFTAADSRPPA